MLKTGWKEECHLPALLPFPLEAKLDTGAQVSALHAEEIIPFTLQGAPWIRFSVHGTFCHAPLLQERTIYNSAGTPSHRPIIRTLLRLGPQVWSIELSLTNRSQMICPLLLGREALHDHILVDSSRQHLLKSIA